MLINSETQNYVRYLHGKDYTYRLLEGSCVMTVCDNWEEINQLVLSSSSVVR